MSSQTKVDVVSGIWGDLVLDSFVRSDIRATVAKDLKEFYRFWKREDLYRYCKLCVKKMYW
jgi:hypothetical protein